MARRKLGRSSGPRKAMMRSQVTALLQNGKLVTTEPKAKELRRVTEKMITLGKRGDLHARRQALAYILDETVVTNLFEETAPKYSERNGGYTRIIKIGPRKGDGAPMAQIELV
ncbi:MAG TPA: 50S ribosomal protein L17 [Thermoanaerobacterales bacterium]|nr:50S ribosomal protein L17 [Thermoanaerobacterales bacterium]